LLFTAAGLTAALSMTFQHGASHGLSNNERGRLNPATVGPLHSTAQARILIHPGMRHRRHSSTTGPAKAHIAHERRLEQGNRRGGRLVRQPSGLNGMRRRCWSRAIAPRRPRTFTTRRTRAVVTPTVAMIGIGPFRVGLLTAAPHPEVDRSNRCHMGMRVRVRCPVEVHTRVSEAKAVLLGRIDRHAHVSRLTSLLVTTDQVLEDDPPQPGASCHTRRMPPRRQGRHAVCTCPRRRSDEASSRPDGQRPCPP